MSYREIGIQVHELGTWVQSVESFTARVEDLALDPQCPRKKARKGLHIQHQSWGGREHTGP